MDNQLSHVCEENNTDNKHFACNSHVNNYEKKKKKKIAKLTSIVTIFMTSTLRRIQMMI